jgi:plastocyanin
MLPRRALALVVSAPLLLATACAEVSRVEPNRELATAAAMAKPTAYVSAKPTPTATPTAKASASEPAAGGSASASPGASPSEGGEGGGTEVAATVDNKFEPAKLEVKVGQEVTWTNTGGAHTVTGGKDAPDPASPIGNNNLFDPNATVKKKFDKAGTYDYFCQPHLSVGMVGQIVVK